MSFLKRLYLKYIVGYKNPKKYWDRRWRSRIEPKDEIEYRRGIFERISGILSENGCRNVLEMGCGQAWLRDLPNYLGLDFSMEALRQSKLPAFLYADVTKKIPLPDKSFDAVISLTVMMHIPDKDIENTIIEVSRVAKKCVILQESFQAGGFHCFSHDYEGLFKEHFHGKLYFLNKDNSIEAQTE